MAAVDANALSRAALPALALNLSGLIALIAASAGLWQGSLPWAACAAALTGLLWTQTHKLGAMSLVSSASMALVAAVLAAMVAPELEPWQVPSRWIEFLQIRPLSAALVGSVYLVYCLRRLRAGTPPPWGAHPAVLALPLLFNALLALSSATLMSDLGRHLSSGDGAAWLGRIVLLLAFNEVLLFGTGLLLDRRGTWRWQVHALLVGGSILVCSTPLIADLAHHPALASLPWAVQALCAIPLAALSQSGLWAETFLVTGILLDALHGRRPTAEACLGHFRSGLLRGAIYAALFMGVVLMLAGLASVHAFGVAVRTLPPLAGLLLGALAFPLLKTLIESFDGSAPFVLRLRSALRDPLNYARGAVAGTGVGWALGLGFPGFETLDRFLVGAVIGALAYGGVDLARDAVDWARQRRGALQSVRVYGLGAVLGAFVGGALAWYFDAAQLAAVISKLGAYAALSYAESGREPMQYVVYPLFSKWGAIDLGMVEGGVKLLYAESLSGVINWSLAAPLFSINLVLLTALFEKSTAPLRELLSPQGVARLVEQAVRVLRWGLWMAPVIYSFLRLAPDPTWYNQDGAVRTVVATIQALVLSPADFRAWSLSVFLGLLAYDALRVLIWFDHMGLRVATLVNLSFVGGDALDEKAARFVGHSARTRVIPEGIRRFLTWAPLLIPFYIPRGAEWDQVWEQAQELAASDDPLLPAVATLLVGYRLLAIALAAGAAWLIVQRLRRPPSPPGVSAPAPFVIGNGRYFVEMSPDGCGYSRCESEVRPGFQLDLTRRPDDPLALRGKFFYLRELGADGQSIGAGWSLTQEPMRYGVSAVTLDTPSRLRIVRTQAGIRIVARIEVAATEPVETWDLHLHNTGEQARVLELISYQEPAVGPVDAYRRTPAFASMHLGTVFIPALGALLTRNRLLRTAAADPADIRMSREVGFHAFSGDASLTGFQDSRADFMGLGTLRQPQARMEDPIQEGLRYSFDPCASLRLRIELAPGQTCRLRFVDGYAPDERSAARRIARFLHRPVPLAADLKFLSETVRKRPVSADPILEDWSDPWSADGRELDAPTRAQRPWPHVIANSLGHGAVLSSDGAIFAFAGNAQQNALTPACLESTSAQQPGELFLVRDLERQLTLSPTRVPLRQAEAEYRCRFGLGWARFEQRASDIEASLEVFADAERPAQFRVLRLRNLGAAPRRLRVLCCADIVLAETGPDSRGRLLTERVPTADAGSALLFRNPRNDFVQGWAFVASSLECTHIHALRSQVYGATRDPAQMHLLLTGQIDGRQADDGWRCAAFCAEISLAPGATHESVLVLGQCATQAEAIPLIGALRPIAKMRQARLDVDRFWTERLGVLRVRTADPGFDRLVNDWLPYQLLVSRLWGRTGPAQRSGAFGFRDQLQDVLPLVWIAPELARRQLLLHAAQQFREGDGLKWWHNSREGRTGIGVRTRASDPHLWLPHVLVRYLSGTGDQAILDEPVAFIEGGPVPAGQEGYLLAPRPTRERATLYEHCRRAIDLSLRQRGVHGLPLLGSGDWNDGLDVPGLQMRGESVWMGFFLHQVLVEFAEIAQTRNDTPTVSRYHMEAGHLRIALDASWRDTGFLRATSDDGVELVYADALTSSWAALSGAVDLERSLAALEQGLLRLERETRVRLLSPAFDEQSLPYPGRIAEYPPGVRENGGQYSHGSSWLVDAWLHCADMARTQGRAELAQRCRERAAGLWMKISPLSRGTAAELPRYGLPPHQQPADVYDGPGYEGRGGWAWYTGAAARMLTTAHALMGLRMDGYRLRAEPTAAITPVSVQYRGRVLTPGSVSPALPTPDAIAAVVLAPPRAREPRPAPDPS